MNVFKKVEKNLRMYPIDKKIIEEMKDERKNIIHRMNSPLASINQGRGSMHSDQTATKVIEMNSNYTFERAMGNVRAIEDVLEILDEIDRKIVELKYFTRGFSEVAIMMKVGVSRSTLYARRKKVLKLFARRMGLL